VTKTRQPYLKHLYMGLTLALERLQTFMVLFFLATAINFLVAFGLITLVLMPESVLVSKTFLLNYTEIKRVAQIENNVVFHPLQQPRVLQTQKDPNWDGLLSGGATGLVLSQYCPFMVGYLVFPVTGMLAGYQLDRKI
jgi:hypothetical protein